MFLQSLVGQAFDENVLFQNLIFEIETNYDFYDKKYLHLSLETDDHKKFKVTKVTEYAERAELNDQIKKILKKKYWIRISSYSGGIILVFCRQNLSTQNAIFAEDGNTLIQEGAHLDPDAPPIVMTEDEIRLAFIELCGLMENSTNNELKPKKAI